VVIGSKIVPNLCTDVIGECNAALDRLGIDCIDLYMVHWPIDKNSMAHFASHAKIAGGGRDYAVSDQSITPDAPPTEIAFKTLMKLQAAGKIKHSKQPCHCTHRTAHAPHSGTREPLSLLISGNVP